MRFKVTYGSGMSHEVELPASVAVVGRDPGCDIVLNDSKCSRRHAIFEQGPDALTVRDSGSANGVFLNGRPVDAAKVKPGDIVRLGDVQMLVLTEVGETVIVALDEVEAHQPPAPAPAGPIAKPAATPPARSRPAEAGASVRPKARGDVTTPAAGPASGARPLTVVMLSLLWSAFVPASVAAALLVAARIAGGPATWLAAGFVSLALAAGGAAMASGLWRLAPWARHLQVVAAYLGLLVCPLTLASATILLYMGRADVRQAFEPPGAGPRRGAGEAEPTFALSIVAMLCVGIVATAAAWRLLSLA